MDADNPTSLPDDDGSETVTLTKKEVEQLRAAVTAEQNKGRSLNRELSRARKRMEDSSATAQQLASVQSQLGELLSLFASAEGVPDDQRARALQLKSSADTRSSSSRLEEYYRNKIGEVLEEADMDWEDESLADAHKKWDAKDWDAAWTQAMKIAMKTKKMVTEPSPDEGLKKSGARVADLKESNAGGGGGVKRADYGRIRPGVPVRELQRQMDALDARFFR